MDTLQILDPTRAVPLRDGSTLTVRELAWPDFAALLKRLGQQAAEIGRVLYGDPELVEAAGKSDREKLTERVLANLTEIITGSVELTQFIIEKSVAEPDRARVPHLRATDALRILEAALDLTLSEEIFAAGNGVAVALTRVFKTTTATMKTTTTAATSPSAASATPASSSTRDILRPLPTPSPSASSRSTAASPATA